MKRFVLIAVVMLAFAGVQANSGEKNQEKALKWSLGMDLKTQHTWRGGLTTNQFNFQPAGTVSFKNWYFGVWTIFTESGNYSEADFYIGYTKNRFNLALYDYYCPGKTSNFGNKIFSFDKDFDKASLKTKGYHSLDLSIDYTLSKEIPLNFLVSTYIYNNVNSKNDERFSTYCEVSYKEKLKYFDMKAFVGGTPHASSYSPDGAGIVNAGFTLTYPIKIKNYTLPFYASVVSNPEKKQGYLFFGLNVSL